VFPVPDSLWKDQLTFSLMKTAFSVLKSCKLRKWAPHLVSELSFYSLGQNYQPVSNLLCTMDKVCLNCYFGKFQKWYSEPLGRWISREVVPKCFLNTTILCSVLGNIRRLLHLCKHTDLLALCLGSRSTWFQKLSQKPFRSGEIKTLFVCCHDWLAAVE